METTESAQFASEFKLVHAEFTRWRRSRRAGESIPDPLWARAVELARRFGVSQAAPALRLNPTVLKRRLQQTLSAQLPSPQDVQRFVELPPLETSSQRLSAPPPVLERSGEPRSDSDGRSPCELRVLVRSPDGSSLRMELARADGQEVARLLAAFWERPCSTR